MAAYALEGPRWGSGAAGTGGGTLTWALDATVPQAFLGDIRAAFDDWAAHAGIAFQQVASTGAADIRFADGAIDGPNRTLGVTNYRYAGATFTSASVTLDSGEGWHASGGHVVSADGASLFLVALHEIGHALGLDHYNAAPAVMNAVLSASLTDLTASDVAGIQALYGAPAGAGAATTASGTPSVVTTGTTAQASDHLNPVHRFFDTHTGDHFYTTSTAEAEQVKATIPFFTYEGAAWATPDKGAGTRDVFRFFDTRTGTHLFTADAGERDQIVRTLPNYQYEGVAFQAYADPAAAGPGGVTLERFFDTKTGQHHMAGSAAEAYGINHGAAGPGWVDEGAAFTVHAPGVSLLFA